MKNRFKQLFLVLFIVMISSCSITKQELKNDFRAMKIQGFTQFDIYRSSEMLGYVPSGNKKFNFKVWEGAVKKDKLEQTINLRYRGQSFINFSSRVLGIASVALSNQQIVGIDVMLINPVEYSLENPSPAIAYTKREDFLKKQYIGSVLKVDKIKVKFIKKDGTSIAVAASYKLISASGKYEIKQEQKALYFAKNAFIGYKLFTPPKNAVTLRPFTFRYQFLYMPPKETRWQLLNSHDEIKTGGSLKFQMRSSSSAYIYVFNLDSGGYIHTLFPNPALKYQNPLQGGKNYLFPKKSNLAYTVDTVKGIEEFIIVVFREKPRGMKALLDKISKKTITTATFKQAPLIINSRGVGEIKVIKVKTVKESLGFKFAVREIIGLGADYKEIFILRHK